MTEGQPDIASTLFILPPDAKFLPVSELSPRLRSRIGPVEEGQAVITRPGLRVTTRLVPAPLAELIGEFRDPSLLTDAVARFARAHDEDPFTILDFAFDALASLVEARILVPDGSPDASAPVPTLSAGQMFAGFEIEALVRSLDDSEVYRARGDDAASVALKVARDDSPVVAAMLANEARALKHLGGRDSPALVEDGLDRGRTWLAMEWFDGVSIGVAAQQARATGNRRRSHRLVAGMLAVYGRLHEQGVVHGDVHPGNCLVGDDGRIVLIDLGHARRISGSTAAVDPMRGGITQFHDPHMAREILAGRLPPAATPASEQYAIAVLAYVLLTGLQPIDTPFVQVEMLRRIVERPPLPFAARGIAAWPEVEAVLGRALAKEPGERYPDVATFARAFASADPADARPPRWPVAARRVFGRELAAVRNLAPAAGSRRDRAWFALRAAIALDDAEVLAAADILARRAGPSWAAQTVATQVARARSDASAESAATARFLTAAEPGSAGSGAPRAILAAATLLERGTSSSEDAALLATFARRGLDRLTPSVPSTDTDDAVTEPLPTVVALTLCKAGAMAVPDDLRARLQALCGRRSSDVWLWGLAHDVLADDDYLALAVEAPLPRRPLERGFALIRLHQLTGERTWVRAAVRLAATAPSRQLPDPARALLMAELVAPETAVLPPFMSPVRLRRPSPGPSPRCPSASASG